MPSIILSPSPLLVPITCRAKTSLAMTSHLARPSQSPLNSSPSKPIHTCTMTSPGDHQPQNRISVLSPPDNEARHPLPPSRLARDKEHPTSAKPTRRVSTSHLSRNLHGERVSIAPLVTLMSNVNCLTGRATISLLFITAAGRQLGCCTDSCRGWQQPRCVTMHFREHRGACVIGRWDD